MYRKSNDRIFDTEAGLQVENMTNNKQFWGVFVLRL